MGKLATRGQETELVSAIVRQFPYGKVPAERAQQLIEHQDELAALLVTMFTAVVATVVNAFSVVVDYSKSLKAMIEDGHYDWKNNDITSDNFSVTGSGQVNSGLELVHFGKHVSTQDVLAELDKRNLCPATLPELLAFGAKYPEEQRKYPIIALGSVWADRDGRRDVACLCGNDRGRDLGLVCYVFGWRGYCRFLAASK
jgi:hypothetical protein